jgi:Flp pilus assembly protein protease CpaA
MLKGLIIFTALLICVIDINTHLIPNRLTMGLGILLFLDLPLSLGKAAIPAIIITIAFGTLARFGAGDIKLFIALILTASPIVTTAAYFQGMALVSMASILISRLISGADSKTIAFAPALLLPFLALYLAI